VEKIEFIPKTLQFIQRPQFSEHLKIIVTNQSGVARNIFNLFQLQAFHTRFLSECQDDQPSGL